MKNLKKLAAKTVFNVFSFIFTLIAIGWVIAYCCVVYEMYTHDTHPVMHIFQALGAILVMLSIFGGALGLFCWADKNKD